MFLGSITQERVRQSPDGLEIIKDERRFERMMAKSSELDNINLKSENHAGESEAVA